MFTLPVDKQVKVQVQYVDGHGNPATVDGGVIWETSNEDIAQVWYDEDDPANSFEAVVAPSGTTGQVQITAKADADVGSGIRELVTLMNVSVVAGEAVAGVITPVGEPGDIPHPSPR